MDRKTESVSRPDGKKGVRAGRIYIRYAAAFGILTGLLLILQYGISIREVSIFQSGTSCRYFFRGRERTPLIISSGKYGCRGFWRR